MEDGQPPTTEAELFARAERLAGVTLGAIASRFGLEAPLALTRHKGWVGNLLERALGATAGSRAEPDFEALGVELKTLPVDTRGRPLESTFVCTIPLSQIGEVEWDASRVRRKLRRVLWIPVEGTRSLDVPQRRVGAPLLWSPNVEELAALRSTGRSSPASSGVVGSTQSPDTWGVAFESGRRLATRARVVAAWTRTGR